MALFQLVSNYQTIFPNFFLTYKSKSINRTCIILYSEFQFCYYYAFTYINNNYFNFPQICWIIKLCPSNTYSLLVARVFCGLGAGGCFHVIPMYIKEISQDNIRGTLGSICMLFQNVGILTMYAIGGYLDYYTVLYLVTAITAFIFVILFQIPESPSFLVNRGQLKVCLTCNRL